MRPSKRQPDEMRAISFERGVSKHAEGSCLVKFGDTHVLCTASLEEKVPAWMRNTGKGWVTAEYGMLPRSTGERMRREASRQAGRPHAGNPAPDRPLAARRGRPPGAGRAADHRRLRRHPGRWRHAHRLDHRRLGRAPRLPALDGGAQMISVSKVLKDHVAAISCGIHDGQPVLDLDYLEDSSAGTDANFVMTGKGGIVEIQGTAEGEPFTEEQFAALMGSPRRASSPAGQPAADGGGVRFMALRAVQAGEAPARALAPLGRGGAECNHDPLRYPRIRALRRRPRCGRGVSTAKCWGSSRHRQGAGPACLLPLRRRACCCCSTPKRRGSAAAGCEAAGAAARHGRPGPSVLFRDRRRDRRWKARLESPARASRSRPISNGRRAAARSISATRPAIRSNSPNRVSGAS
jgi:ribonuclease PH